VDEQGVATVALRSFSWFHSVVIKAKNAVRPLMYASSEGRSCTFKQRPLVDRDEYVCPAAGKVHHEAILKGPRAEEGGDGDMAVHGTCVYGPRSLESDSVGYSRRSEGPT
jgi:streptomycin 6-kinase